MAFAVALRGNGEIHPGQAAVLAHVPLFEAGVGNRSRYEFFKSLAARRTVAGRRDLLKRQPCHLFRRITDHLSEAPVAPDDPAFKRGMQDAHRSLLKRRTIALFTIAEFSLGLALFDHAVDLPLGLLCRFEFFDPLLLGYIRRSHRNHGRSFAHDPVEGDVQAPAVQQPEFHARRTAGQRLFAEFRQFGGAFRKHQPLRAQIHGLSGEKTLADRGLKRRIKDGKAGGRLFRAGRGFRWIDTGYGILVSQMEHGVLPVPAMTTVTVDRCASQPDFGAIPRQGESSIASLPDSHRAAIAPGDAHSSYRLDATLTLRFPVMECVSFCYDSSKREGRSRSAERAPSPTLLFENHPFFRPDRCGHRAETKGGCVPNDSSPTP